MIKIIPKIDTVIPSASFKGRSMTKGFTGHQGESVCHAPPPPGLH